VDREITTDTAVLERLAEPAGKDVLDVGCGFGELVRALARGGARPIGLETSEEQLASARERDPDRVGGYLVGRAEALPLSRASVDLVVFMRSLHHVAIGEMTAALSEARRVLRPGGAVYVAEPLTEGSFYELVNLVEDEREVRQAAQQALAREVATGLRRVSTVEYAVEGLYRGVEAFRARVLGADPGREPIFEARRSEIEEAFERLGEPGEEPGQRRFLQPMRADLLRPPVP
jgi:ubiquinone/menaquinone biosynthesis C-methylase UbiE